MLYVFTNIINPRSSVVRKDKFTKTIVKKGASIGANATILCGITLGFFCLIGAGSVVTKSVPNYALIIGNPGHQIGWVSEYGHTLKFDDNGFSNCPESNQRYQLIGGRIKKYK